MRYLVNFLVVFLLLTGAQALAETPEEEARERAERSAPPGGFREGEVVKKDIEVYLDGKLVGAITPEELSKIQGKRIFTPRGPKRGRPVVDAIKGEGIKNAGTVNFIDDKGKKLSLQWDDLVRAERTVVLTYNFKGHLVLETDVNDSIPDHARDADEDKVREEMHKNRQRSLIFLRNVSRIEIESN